VIRSEPFEVLIFELQHRLENAAFAFDGDGSAAGGFPLKVELRHAAQWQPAHVFRLGFSLCDFLVLVG
jgi:hypothetical protein